MSVILTKEMLQSIIQEQLGDMDEMAKELKYAPKELSPIVVLEKNQLFREKDRPIGAISTINPETELPEDDMIYGTESVTINSCEFIKIRNYSQKNTKNGRPGAVQYVKLNPEENPDSPFVGKYEYYTEEPRNAKCDTSYTGPKNKMDSEQYSKRYTIFPNIKNLFNREDIITHLESCLIPVITIEPKYTEPTTNVERKQSFGGKTPDINFKFVAKVNYKNLEAGLNHIINARGKAAGGEKINKTPVDRIPRHNVARTRAWSHTQSISNTETFKQAGEYTKILKLFKKNIFRGDRNLNVVSYLVINGAVDTFERDGEMGGFYVLEGSFFPELNYREESMTKGKLVGNLIDTIKVDVNKEIPQGINPEEFNIINHKEFFVDLLTELLNKLGDKILEIDRDEVLNKITNLLQNRSDEDNSFLNESKKMKKKIKLTEGQLNRVIKTINEQKFDDAFTNLSAQNKEISMTHDDAVMLFNLGKNWCQGKEENPDCAEIEQLRIKLNLY